MKYSWKESYQVNTKIKNTRWLIVKMVKIKAIPSASKCTKRIIYFHFCDVDVFLKYDALKLVERSLC